LIAAIAAYSTDSGWFGFFAVLVGLQVIYFLLWLEKTVWMWVVFWMRGRGQAVDHMYDQLRSDGYPEPDAYHGSVDDYLTKTMDDKQVPIGARLKAAGELGALRLGLN
jgi:hypothetical protein